MGDRNLKTGVTVIRRKRGSVHAGHVKTVLSQCDKEKAKCTTDFERTPGQTPATQEVCLASSPLRLASVISVADGRLRIEVVGGIELQDLCGREPRSHLMKAARPTSMDPAVKHLDDTDFEPRLERVGGRADVARCFW